MLYELVSPCITLTIAVRVIVELLVRLRNIEEHLGDHRVRKRNRWLIGLWLPRKHSPVH